MFLTFLSSKIICECFFQTGLFKHGFSWSEIKQKTGMANYKSDQPTVTNSSCLPKSHIIKCVSKWPLVSSMVAHPAVQRNVSMLNSRVMLFIFVARMVYYLLDLPSVIFHSLVSHYFALRSFCFFLVGFRVYFGSLSTWTVKCRPSFVALGWIWAQVMALYTS